MGEESPRVAVIVNPRSANGGTAKRWSALAATIGDAVGDYTPYVTQRPGHATELTRTALHAGHDRIVSIGGDGTHYEVLNGFFEEYLPINPAASLAIVPQGTGSDLARLLRLKTDTEAIERIVNGKILKIDVGRATVTLPEGGTGVRYFINIADLGAGGEVAERVNRHSKAMGGFASFLLGVLKTLMTFRAPVIRLQIDGEIIEQRCMDVIMANGQYYGGGIHVAPEARLDSGRFEVFVVRDLSILRGLRSLPKFYTGRMKELTDLVSHRGASHIVAQSDERVLVNLDGELPGVLPASVELLPSALPLVVGDADVAGDRGVAETEDPGAQRGPSGPGDDAEA